MGLNGDAFAKALRGLRAGANLTQQVLADRAGLAVSTVQSYEQGRRLPDSTIFPRLTRALELRPEQEDELRRAIGLRPAPSGLEAVLRRVRAPAETLWDEVQESPWVTLVLNERREIVAWNALANRTSDRDLGELDQFHRSVFRMAATDHYERHLLNWDQLLGRLIALFKLEGSDMTQGQANEFVQAVVDSINREDPRFLPRIFNLYLNAPPWDEFSRNLHTIRWRLDDGTDLHFQGAFADWSQYDGLWAFDWHAADAPTAEWVNARLREPGWESAPPPRPSFAEALADYRRNSLLSRSKLAELSGLSAGAIAAYESGQRSPGREAILALCRSLNIDAYATNRFLREEGFEEEPGDWARWLAGETPMTIYRNRSALRPLGAQAFFKQADKLPFPSVILDNGCHALHANPLARRLVDFGAFPRLGGRPAPHLLQLMVSDHFLSAIQNWEEVAGVFLPGRLQNPILGSESEASTSTLVSLGRELRATNREGLDRMAAVWTASEGFTSLRRPGVRVRWCTPAGDELVFNCTASGISPADPYKSLDFYPADAATFAWLERRPGRLVRV